MQAEQTQTLTAGQHLVLVQQLESLHEPCEQELLHDPPTQDWPEAQHTPEQRPPWSQ